MAELEIARPRGRVAARRRGFIAFCAMLVALIAALLVGPVGASADRRTAPSAPRADRRAESTHGTDAGAPHADPVTVSPRQIPAETFDRLLASGAPIWCGAGTKPLVALTFDDGPGPDTLEALAMLERAGMSATFFEVGKLVGADWFDGITTEVGRVDEIGNHTWDHVSMVGASQAELEHQILDTSRAIHAQTGDPVRLFRPPLGARDDALLAFTQQAGLLPVMWSVDSGDSQGASADQIVRTLQRDLSPGDIVLLHENRGTTFNALPRIIQLIQERGYRAVTVSQLLTLDPPTEQQLRTGTCPS